MPRSSLLLPLVLGAIGADDAAAASGPWYVALGDSTGVGVGGKNGGYVARVHERLRRTEAAFGLKNLCRAGATSEDVLEAQVPRLPSTGVGLVTLAVGVNDVGRGVSPAQFARNLDGIIRAVRARHTGPVVVANLPDVSAAPAVPAAWKTAIALAVTRYNGEIAAVVGRHRGVTLFDVFEMSRRELPRHPEYFSTDGFHPSDAGYDFWAERLWAVVRALL